MLNGKAILDIFRQTSAILEGHFKLSSGLHSGQYLQCALVLKHPEHCRRLCAELAKKFKKETPNIVIAPALGGVLVSYETASALGVPSLFTERKDGQMLLRRGFSLAKGDRVLVVEDVITTGRSTKEVIDAVKKAGADVVGVGAIVERSAEPIDFGARFESLIKINIPAFKPEECPLCKKKLPITKPGSRPA